MLTLPPAVRIYVAAEPVDMRRSFHGLASAVRGQLQLDPASAKLHGVNVRKWPTQTLDRLAAGWPSSRIDELLPAPLDIGGQAPPLDSGEQASE